MLKGHFSHLFVVKFVLFALKEQKMKKDTQAGQFFKMLH